MATKPDDIEAQVKTIIIEQLLLNDDHVLGPDTNFEHDLGADSLDFVELLIALEDHFGIEIPDELAEKVKTVGEAITALKTLIEPKA